MLIRFFSLVVCLNLWHFVIIDFNGLNRLSVSEIPSSSNFGEEYHRIRELSRYYLLKVTFFQFKGIINDTNQTKWYFWPCEFKL